MNEPLRKVPSYFIITITVTVHFHNAYPMKTTIHIVQKHARTRTGGVEGEGGECRDEL